MVERMDSKTLIIAIVVLVANLGTAVVVGVVFWQIDKLMRSNPAKHEGDQGRDQDKWYSFRLWLPKDDPDFAAPQVRQAMEGKPGSRNDSEPALGLSERPGESADRTKLE